MTRDISSRLYTSVNALRYFNINVWTETIVDAKVDIFSPPLSSQCLNLHLSVHVRSESFYWSPFWLMSLSITILVLTSTRTLSGSDDKNVQGYTELVKKKSRLFWILDGSMFCYVLR